MRTHWGHQRPQNIHILYLKAKLPWPNMKNVNKEIERCGRGGWRKRSRLQERSKEVKVKKIWVGLKTAGERESKWEIVAHRRGKRQRGDRRSQTMILMMTPKPMRRLQNDSLSISLSKAPNHLQLLLLAQRLLRPLLLPWLSKKGLSFTMLPPPFQIYNTVLHTTPLAIQIFLHYPALHGDMTNLLIVRGCNWPLRLVTKHLFTQCGKEKPRLWYLSTWNPWPKMLWVLGSIYSLFSHSQTTGMAYQGPKTGWWSFWLWWGGSSSSTGRLGTERSDCESMPTCLNYDWFICSNRWQSPSRLLNMKPSLLRCTWLELTQAGQTSVSG